MLEAAKARPRFTISLKRSTQNLQLSTSSSADYPILVQLCFDFYMIEAKPENLIGDRLSVSKSPEEDNEAGELHKAQEVLSVVFPTNKDTALPLDPGKEALDEPTSPF